MLVEISYTNQDWDDKPIQTITVKKYKQLQDIILTYYGSWHNKGSVSFFIEGFRSNYVENIIKLNSLLNGKFHDEFYQSKLKYGNIVNHFGKVGCINKQYYRSSNDDLGYGIMFPDCYRGKVCILAFIVD